MTPWHDERLCVLDCETTSADPERARIVTLAVGYVSGEKPTDLQTLVAYPMEPIPAEAAAIHGWTTERARAEGRDAVEVLDIALGFLDRRPEGSPVVAYNARFDLTVLDRECRRHGLEPPDARRPMLVVDPLVIDRHLDRYRPGKRTLTALCGHYGARLDQAHAAASDAIGAGRLAWVIAKRGRLIRRVRDEHEHAELLELQREWETVRDDLELLHHAQQRWAAEQARSLAEHFERKGQPHQVVADWPVIQPREVRV